MKDRPFQTVLIVFGSFVLWIIIILFDKVEVEIDDECPTEYERFNVFSKEYKALVIKKNGSGGEGMTKATSSLDLNNKGKIIHVPISTSASSSRVFDGELWEHILEGDSIIKERNSYQVKVIKITTFKIFDIDCEQFKKELESKNKNK